MSWSRYLWPDYTLLASPRTLLWSFILLNNGSASLGVTFGNKTLAWMNKRNDPVKNTFLTCWKQASVAYFLGGNWRNKWSGHQKLWIISAGLPTTPREEQFPAPVPAYISGVGTTTSRKPSIWMALSFWTFLQCKIGCSGKSHFLFLRLYDLKLSFQIKDASTDFYEHRQKLLQPWCPPPPSP